MLFNLLYCLKIYLGINYGIFTITLGIDLIKTDFARKTPKKEGIRTFAQFAIALRKPMKKE
jgi:hypothetical protein